MSDLAENKRIARCVCGSVELETTGKPIFSVVCHCDDCQEGSGQIEHLGHAPPILDQAGGTAYLLFRKDRMKCVKGAENLRDYKFKDESPTRRVVASCCNSFMFLDFQKGHWFSMFRGRFIGDVPAVQMRIQTKFKPKGSDIPNDARIYSRYPPMLIGKLLVIRLAMLFHW